VILVKVKVPDSLKGASLLGAHNWIRSQMVKENPSGGSTDYTISTPDGTPLSLSDLTALNFRYDEVLINQHPSEVLSNPNTGSSDFIPEDFNPLLDKKGRTGRDRVKSTYPIPVPDYGYPQYAFAPKLGDNVNELLPGDITPDMVSRLIAQQGRFGALNSIVKVAYSVEEGGTGVDFTKPSIASLLQRYANAQTDHVVKKNPGSMGVFGPGELNKHKGLVTPLEAVRQFMGEEFEVDDLDPDVAKTMLDKARITNEYKLDDDDREYHRLPILSKVLFLLMLFHDD